MISVILSSCGNPDFKQNPKKSLSPLLHITVDTLKEARGRCLAYIAKWNLGGGNWSGGQVWKNDKQIARISYNGRIWDMDKTLNDTRGYGNEIIFDI